VGALGDHHADLLSRPLGSVDPVWGGHPWARNVHTDPPTKPHIWTRVVPSCGVVGVQQRPGEGAKNGDQKAQGRRASRLSDQALKLYFRTVAYEDRQAGRLCEAQDQIMTVTTIPLPINVNWGCTDDNRQLAGFARVQAVKVIKRDEWFPGDKRL